MRKNIFIVILSMFVFLGMFVPQLTAAFPRFMNFQGMLTDDTGQPKDGIFSFKFLLYEVETGVGSVWDETHNFVRVSDGLYSVVLGTSIPLSGVNFNQELWLEVEVDENVLTPRYRLTASPFSFFSATAAFSLAGGSADNLGNHTATRQLNMGGFAIITSSGITWADGTVQVSSPVAITDNLGNHQATTTLNMVRS